MDNVAPIRPNVQPAMDKRREMMQFVAEGLESFFEKNGCEPLSIALVLIGPNEAGISDYVSSWSPGNEDRSREHTCSIAAALLMKRAIGD